MNTGYASLALVLLSAAPLVAQPLEATYEDQPAVALRNDRISMVVSLQGASIVSLIMNDDPEKVNPLWNPVRLAREQGRQVTFSGSAGHFVCVDGFGQPSAEERAAGLPMHGEAHRLRFDVDQNAVAHSLTMRVTLPLVHEAFTRTFRMVDGENVVYVESQLENLLGFDRPVNWGEHATIGAPFLEPEVSWVDLSGSRSQTRPYADPARRRLLAGQDFTWPSAPGLDGGTIDMRGVPPNPHYLDHATTVFDEGRPYAWVTAINTRRRLIYGYLLKREEYPWLQHWGNYPADSLVVRGMEFATQPYDVARRDAIDTGSLFGVRTYRWLPANSRITSHFLLFYARLPEGFRKVDDVRLENGRLTIEDSGTGQRVSLAASLGLP